MSYCFWRDAYLLFNSDAAMHQMPKWVPAFWLFTHGFLTCLQVCVLCLLPFVDRAYPASAERRPTLSPRRSVGNFLILAVGMRWLLGDEEAERTRRKAVWRKWPRRRNVAYRAS